MGVDTDIDGRPRICGAAPDLGPFESGDCGPAKPFILRGDCNGDCQVDLSDALKVLFFSFGGGPQPPCRAACDANGDGDLGGVADAIYLLRFAFLNGAPPAAPFPACGPSDRASDLVLGCDSAPGCP